MFSETSFMEQDSSSKNRLALVKTNRVSKYVVSAQKHTMNIKRLD